MEAITNVITQIDTLVLGLVDDPAASGNAYFHDDPHRIYPEKDIYRNPSFPLRKTLTRREKSASSAR